MDDKMPDMTGTPRGNYLSSSAKMLQQNNPANLKKDFSRPLKEDTEKGQTNNSGNILTSDEIEDAELQKAIALSLQHESDSGASNIASSSNDKLTRASTQSLGKGDRRNRSVGASGDCHRQITVNPRNLLRVDTDWPTGLKNVGNSCWFNVVVQSLFHLPYFRYIVLKFTEMESVSANHETQKNLRLIQELRCLFSLMLASKKSYVDPQNCVEVLQETFSNANINSQQDVSEFIHVLLDSLEDVFQYMHETSVKREHLEQDEEDNSGVFASSPIDSFDDLSSTFNSSQKKMGNPMLELFYGTSKTVDASKVTGVSQEDTFGILPLCVEGCRNLHESLEHATARGNTGSSREVWFTKLPPVLTFQLSRFNFNQNLGKPEKLHDRLVFPSVLYMDRYMECNMEITRTKREEVRQLSLQLYDLRLRLSRISTIRHSGTSYSLSNVLSCCASFAAQKQAEDNVTDEAITLSSKLARRRSRSQSSGDETSPNKKSRDADLADLDSRSESIREPNENTEARYVEQVLHKWMDEIDEQLQEFQQTLPSGLSLWRLLVGICVGTDYSIILDLSSFNNVLDVPLIIHYFYEDLRYEINSVEQNIDKIYEEQRLRRHRYTLHAVLVHQGQALAGHYWAYIYDYNKKIWLKFNDALVTTSSFESLANDSMGGIHSRYHENCASAYCLIYVDSNKSDLFFERDCMRLIASDPVLSKLLNKHNERIEDELEEWEVEKAKQMSLENDNSPARKSSSTADAADTSENGSALNLAALKKAIGHVISTHEDLGPEKVLKMSSDISPDGNVERCESAQEPIKDEKHAECMLTPPSTSPPLRGNTSPMPSSGKCPDDDEETILCPVLQASLFAIMKVGKTYNLDGPETALDEAVGEELERLRRLSEEDSTLIFDPRLQNIAVYLYQNQADTRVIERCVMEQFTDDRLKHDRRSADIRNCAVENINAQAKNDATEEVKSWKTQYHAFCTATCHLLHGLEFFHKRKFFESVLHFFAVHDHNKMLPDQGDSRRRVDSKFVSRYCRTCVQRISDEAMTKLQSNDEATARSAIDEMRKKLMPCVSALLTKDKGGGSDKDIQLADAIRNDWCSLLERPLVLSRSELSDVLTEFLDVGPSSAFTISMPVVERPMDLCQFYECVMSSLLKESD